MAKPKRPDSPADHRYDYSGRMTRPRENRTRKISDAEPGRSPRAGHTANFYEAASALRPPNGTERFPRPNPRSNLEADVSSNHNDLIRGQGY